MISEQQQSPDHRESARNGRVWSAKRIAARWQNCCRHAARMKALFVLKSTRCEQRSVH